MDRIVKINRFRGLLRSEMPLVTRQTLEWVLINTVRDYADLPPLEDADEEHGPELMSTANEAVAEAVKAQGSQFGGFQLYIARKNVLVMLASRNFAPDFAEQFAFFTPDGRTACSRALASGHRCIISDVANDEVFAPHVRAAREAGWCAVQSTPLKTPAGETLGILSTHFASPRTFTAAELAQMDDHARHVASELARNWA